MIDAYVFIMTEVGNQAQVAQELAQLPGVIRAVVVTGPYDVMARVAAPRHGPPWGVDNQPHSRLLTVSFAP